MNALKEIDWGKAFEKVGNLMASTVNRDARPWTNLTLLLDEPMAGMGTEEGRKILKILQKLKKKTILLIEHDMDVVFALADRITVLFMVRLSLAVHQSIKRG